MNDAAQPIAGDERVTKLSDECLFRRRGVRVWVLSAGFAAAVYFPTMLHGLGWGDNGDAQVRVLLGQFLDGIELARAHITFYLLAIPFQRLTGIESALVANSMAAFFGAVTIGHLGLLMSMFVRRWGAVACGVAMMTLCHTMWQLSAAAEVVTIYTALLTLEWIFLILYVRTWKRTYLWWALFVSGVGLSTHNFELLMVFVYGYLLLVHRVLVPKPWGFTVGVGTFLFVAGASPAIGIVLYDARLTGSLFDSFMSWLVGVHSAKVFNVEIMGSMLAKVVAYVGMNFPTPLVFLAIPGVWLMRKSGRILELNLLLIAFLSFFLFAVRYNVPDQYVFMIPSYLLLILFAAVGVGWLLERYRSRSILAAVLVLSCFGPAVYAVVPGLMKQHFPDFQPWNDRDITYRDPYYWHLRPWRFGYDGAERYVREVYEVLPPNSFLLIGPTARPPFLYLQASEGLRRDVQLNRPGFAQEDWLDPVDPLSPEHHDRVMREGLLFLGSNDPVLISRPLRVGAYRILPFGLVFKVLRPDDDVEGSTVIRKLKGDEDRSDTDS